MARSFRGSLEQSFRGSLEFDSVSKKEHKVDLSRPSWYELTLVEEEHKDLGQSLPDAATRSSN